MPRRTADNWENVLRETDTTSVEFFVGPGTGGIRILPRQDGGDSGQVTVESRARRYPDGEEVWVPEETDLETGTHTLYSLNQAAFRVTISAAGQQVDFRPGVTPR